VVLIQLCKYFIEINDTERESTVWGEINVLRHVERIQACLKVDLIHFQVRYANLWSSIPDRE